MIMIMASTSCYLSYTDTFFGTIHYIINKKYVTLYKWIYHNKLPLLWNREENDTSTFIRYWYAVSHIKSHFMEAIDF